MKKLAGRTEGKVGADIEFICRKAAMLAIREFIESQKSEVRGQKSEVKIAKPHFEEAIKLSIERGDVL